MSKKRPELGTTHYKALGLASAAPLRVRTRHIAPLKEGGDDRRVAEWSSGHQKGLVNQIACDKLVELGLIAPMSDDPLAYDLTDLGRRTLAKRRAGERAWIS